MLSTMFADLDAASPTRASRGLRMVVLSDMQGSLRNAARLSEWFARHAPFSVDVILITGICAVLPPGAVAHAAAAHEAEASAAVGALENVCARVVFARGASDPRVLRPTGGCMAVEKGVVRLADDLVVCGRGGAEGEEVWPFAWRATLGLRLARPGRLRVPPRDAVIGLVGNASDADDAGRAPRGPLAAGLATLRSARSLLTRGGISSRLSAPRPHLALAVVPDDAEVALPPHMASAAQVLRPASFADGNFCIVDLIRPDVWDPQECKEVTLSQLAAEPAWEVTSIAYHSLDHDEFSSSYSEGRAESEMTDQHMDDYSDQTQFAPELCLPSAR